MMTNTTTIYVFAFGDAFKLIFDMMAALVSGSLYSQLLKIAALIGIVLTVFAAIKKRDPLEYAKWLFLYTLMTGLILTPKTTVTIHDITEAKDKQVANVPYVIAMATSLITNIGYALTQKYESLLVSPDNPVYSQTGMLFGSKLMKAARDFKIINPDLKRDMDTFFKNCVVGDIAINRKYGVGDLKTSVNIYDTITKRPSPVRRMMLSNGENLSCIQAVSDEKVGLKVRLDREIKNAYTLWGKRLLPRPPGAEKYEDMFQTYLTNSYRYYQNITDSSANIVMQSMMINAIESGLTHFSAQTDSSAAILNNQFSKSQVQHRMSWSLGFDKAVWFLPMLHTVLMVICLAVFPIILLFATVPGGLRILKTYLLFLFSLQLWPMLFSILNSLVSLGGSHSTSGLGAITSSNIDSLAQVHADMAGVAGFLMMTIPFLAKGFVSNIGEAFANQATSMLSHLQGSTMSLASEVASASYSLGNNSFYNSNANNVSANKLNTNYEHLGGMRTIQQPSGALLTTTGDNHTVYNATPALSQSSVMIASSQGLQDTLTKAKESTESAIATEQVGISKALSDTGHAAYQFNESHGRDMRLGQGVSKTGSFQAQQALAHAWNIAEEVGKKNGISTEEAFAGLTRHSYGLQEQAGFDAKKTIWGTVAEKVAGVSGSVSANNTNSIDNSHSGTNRNTNSTDYGLTKRQEESFRSDLNTVLNYTQNHHFDASGSQSENLLYQVGDDLRDVQSHSQSLNASLTESARISDAQNYVATNAQQLNHNLNQEAVTWAIGKYGQDKIDALEMNVNNPAMQAEQERIKAEFLSHKADSLIHDSQLQSINPEKQYHQDAAQINAMKNNIADEYNARAKGVQKIAGERNVGINHQEREQLQAQVNNVIEQNRGALINKGARGAEQVQQTVNTPITTHKKRPKR